jgi:quercetin dioxygenase-like cupin family protein
VADRCRGILLRVLLGILLAATWPGALAHAQDSGVTSEEVSRGHADYSAAVDGPADIVVAIVRLAPGARTGWHTHAGPVIALVAQGTLSRYTDDGCATLYPTGEVFQETPTVHEGRNEGSEPVELIVTYVLPAGAPSSDPAPPVTAQCGS